MLPWVVNYRSHPRSTRNSFRSFVFSHSPVFSPQTPDVPIGAPLKLWTKDSDQVGTFRHLDLQTCLTLSPLFASSPVSPLLPIPYSHTYTTATLHPLCNQSVTHTFPHDGGCTPLLPSSITRLAIRHGHTRQILISLLHYLVASLSLQYNRCASIRGRNELSASVSTKSVPASSAPSGSLTSPKSSNASPTTAPSHP